MIMLYEISEQQRELIELILQDTYIQLLRLLHTTPIHKFTAEQMERLRLSAQLHLDLLVMFKPKPAANESKD